MKRNKIKILSIIFALIAIIIFTIMNVENQKEISFWDLIDTAVIEKGFSKDIFQSNYELLSENQKERVSHDYRNLIKTNDDSLFFHISAALLGCESCNIECRLGFWNFIFMQGSKIFREIKMNPVYLFNNHSKLFNVENYFEFDSLLLLKEPYNKSKDSLFENYEFSLDYLKSKNEIFFAYEKHRKSKLIDSGSFVVSDEIKLIPPTKQKDQ